MTEHEIASKLFTFTLIALGGVAEHLSENEQLEVVHLLAHREFGIAAETLLEIAREHGLHGDMLNNLIDHLRIATSFR